MNLTKEDYLKHNTGYLVLKCFSGNSGHTRVVEPMEDGFGWYKGVKRLSNDEKSKMTTMFVEPGNLENVASKVTLHHLKRFDLSNETERLILEWLLECKHVISFDGKQSSGQTFFIYNESMDKTRQLSLSKERADMLNQIFNLEPDFVYSTARLLGFSMDNKQPDTVRLFLISQIENNKDGSIINKFKNILTDPQRALKVFLFKLIDKGLVTNARGEFKYKEHFLGASIESTLVFLEDAKNLDLIRMMQEDSGLTLEVSKRKK